MANDRSSCFAEATLSFLIGAATGFIVGVLFAPASGAETRKKIHEGAVKTGEKAKESYEKIAREAEKGIKVVKEKTAEGIDTIKEFVDKKKSELLKKPAEESAKVESGKK